MSASAKIHTPVANAVMIEHGAIHILGAITRDAKTIAAMDGVVTGQNVEVGIETASKTVVAEAGEVEATMVGVRGGPRNLPLHLSKRSARLPPT